MMFAPFLFGYDNRWWRDFGIIALRSDKLPVRWIDNNIVAGADKRDFKGN